MITYQKLAEKELDTFIRMRIRQLREEGATENPIASSHFPSIWILGTSE